MALIINSVNTFLYDLTVDEIHVNYSETPSRESFGSSAPTPVGE